MPTSTEATLSRICVTISDDRMQASIRLNSNDDKSPVKLSEILDSLSRAGVLTNETVFPRAEEFTRLATSDGELRESFVVAEGQAPQGKDETFVWDAKFEKRCTDWLSEAPVNFYTLNSIITVEKGARIGSLSPLVPARDGCDVTGQIIRPTVNPVRLELHNTIRRDEADESIIIANAAGRVVEENHVLRIEETLVIKQDVGFKTGNVDSTVAVQIEGAIPDRFEVKSVGSITVGMSIEAAQVNSGGDVTVSRGVLGRNSGLVQATGNIIAKFCADANLISGNDIRISKQSMNSHLLVGGTLMATNATIVGGSVYARNGVFAGTLGSQRNAHTRIVVGVNPETIRELAIIDRNIGRIAQLAEQLDTVLTPLSANSVALSQDQEDQFDKLTARADEAKEKISCETTRRAKLLAKVYADTKASVSVSGTIHEGTYIRIGDREVKFHDDAKGPVTIEKRKFKNVTEVVSVNQLTGSVSILINERRTPEELLQGFELEQVNAFGDGE